MRIYCGSEDFVQFFEDLVKSLNLQIEYEVIDVDGELEIEITGFKVRFKTIKKIFAAIVSFFKKLFRRK